MKREAASSPEGIKDCLIGTKTEAVVDIHLWTEKDIGRSVRVQRPVRVSEVSTQ